MHGYMNEEVNLIPSWVLELPYPPSRPAEVEANHQHNHRNFIYKYKISREVGGKVNSSKAGSLPTLCSRLQTITMPLASLVGQALVTAADIPARAHCGPAAC